MMVMLIIFISRKRVTNKNKWENKEQMGKVEMNIIMVDLPQHISNYLKYRKT